MPAALRSIDKAQENFQIFRQRPLGTVEFRASVLPYKQHAVMIEDAHSAPPMCTVLIVEDDFAILFVVESALRIEGYDTVAAATRKDALSILRSDQQVDVLFTDINLRGEKRAGLELAEKAVALRPALGVVYTTGGDVRSPMVVGSEFLPKPYTSSQLIKAVGHFAAAA
jgi:CheY-like chemotaxis protein